MFRPACHGRYQPQPTKPPRLTIVDASTWPGIPITTWIPVEPGVPFTWPRGRGIRPIPEDIPVACWLPVKYGLNPHGMRHGHKTWMERRGVASDASIPGKREGGTIRDQGPRSPMAACSAGREIAGQRSRVRTGLQQAPQCCIKFRDIM